jgi:hypothetical protein
MHTYPKPLDGAAYSGIYGAAAVVGFCLSFVDLFEPVVQDERVVTYGNLYEMFANTGGGVAALGLLLIYALITLLGVASVRGVHSPGLPIAIAVIAAVAIAVLAGKPDTGDPKPDFAVGGQMMLGLGIMLIVLSVFHVVHLKAARASGAS